MIVLLAALAIPSLYWDKGPDTAKLLQQSGIHEISVPANLLQPWKAVSGFSVNAADAAAMKKVQPPSIQRRRRTAGATSAPWVDANGWRFLRDEKATYFYDAPGADAALAAAEAFTFGVKAYIHTDEAGLQPLARMLDFLGKLNVPDGAPRTNINFVDDHSPESGEFMNLLVRRNLLFRTTSAPEHNGNIIVQLGAPEYPKSEAGNPALLAEKVRGQLTDEKRLLRIYGSEVVVGRLVGNAEDTTLFLLNYGAARVPVDGLRIRVLGKYGHINLADFDESSETPADVSLTPEAAEFTLKNVPILAVVHLTR